MARWKIGQTVTHNGYKGTISKVFSDGSAVVNYTPHQKDKITGKPKTGILTNLPSKTAKTLPIISTPETFIDTPENIFHKAVLENAEHYIQTILGGKLGEHVHPQEGKLIIGKSGIVKIEDNDFNIVETNTMNKKTLPPIDFKTIQGEKLFWRWNDITVEGRIIVSELEIYTDEGVCSKITEANPQGVFTKYL